MNLKNKKRESFDSLFLLKLRISNFIFIYEYIKRIYNRET